MGLKVRKVKVPYAIKCLRAVEGYVGTRDELADKLGIGRAAIDRWHSDKRVPGKHVRKISEASDNHFTCDELLNHD